MTRTRKAYKGLPMEGWIASWYDRNTGRDTRRFQAAADTVVARVPQGSRVLEVAPGPGYLSIEIAKRGEYHLAGLDISRSFVRIAGENAARAGVSIDFRYGDAAHMPFPDGSFEYVVCTAAFKNFSDPGGALGEIHRVLTPGGEASIQDLRKEASLAEIAEEVRRMELSPVNAALTRWIFRHTLLRNAYSRAGIERLAAESPFGRWEIVDQGIGFELRLTKGGPASFHDRAPSAVNGQADAAV